MRGNGKKIMMVRSQNKELITFLENIQVIKIRKDTDESVRIVFEYDEGSKTMGQYHSYQVALKVLDMIQEAYSEYQIMLNFSVSYLHEFKEKTDGFAIFQMPEDSKVEA